MTFETNYTVTYETKRCSTCGTFWAVESEKINASCRCPKCAGNEIEKMSRMMLAAERSAHSLRGAITRLKRKK